MPPLFPSGSGPLLGAEVWITATQSDDAADDMDEPPIAVLCLAAGTITLIDREGNSVQRTVVAEQELNMRPVRIADTGTNLSNAQIILLY